MKFVTLIVIVLTTITALPGCQSIGKLAGYEPVHERPAPPPPPPARRYYAEEVKNGPRLVNYEQTRADGSGVVRLSNKHCTIQPVKDGVLAYECIVPKPEPKPEAKPGEGGE